jgi:hypothetical protein
VRRRAQGGANLGVIDFTSAQAYNPGVVVPPVAAAHQSMELTAYSVRFCVAPAFGSSSGLALGFSKTALGESFHEPRITNRL